MRKSASLTLSLALAASLSVSCQKSEDDNKDTTDTTSTGGSVNSSGGNTSGSEKIASANSLGELGLTKAFSFSLPGALSGDSGSSLLLAGGRRSQEACQMGTTIKEVTRSLEEVGGFFCHLDVEKEKMAFGKKYLINTNGQEFARLYVDNSQAAAGKITIGFCSQNGENEKNRELITIEGLSDTGPKGRIISTGTGLSQENEEQSWSSDTTFDLTQSGLVGLVASQLHKQGTDTFTRKVELALADAGISTAKLAAHGSHEGSDFSDRGVAMFDGSFGSAIFQSQGSYEGQTYNFARRAYFSEDGSVLTKTDVPESVIPKLTDVPEFLADDFAPEDPADWVGGGCADYDEVVDLDPESEAHQACESDHNNEYDCWNDQSYQSGDENVDVQ